MSKAIRTILSVAISVVLFGALTMAQSSGSSNQSSDQNKDQQHHSKLSKAAFWRHHKNSDKSAQQKKGSQKSQTPAKTAQLRPASAKTTTAGNEQKPQARSCLQHVCCLTEAGTDLSARASILGIDAEDKRRQALVNSRRFLASISSLAMATAYQILLEVSTDTFCASLTVWPSPARC